MLSLKAELLRKQDEVNKIKKTSTLDPFASFVPKRTSHSSNRSHDKKKPEIPKANAEKSESEKRADEDYEMLAKSKRVLEAKAKLYDRMTNSGGHLNSDDTCLVRFNQKKQEDRAPVSSSSESESDDDRKRISDGDDDDDDEKWTEYTDCLGRTRKCLKEDLEFFKRKDRDLEDAAKSRGERSPEREAPKREAPWFVDTKGISSADLPLYKPTSDDDTMSMLSKSTKMEEMRVQWEQKEQDNLNRDQIHYQDVLFDEARSHGVGYYAFSVDTAEREKQQKVLDIEREKTLEEQRKREQVRLAREKIVTERVFGAKNRQRARAGLPPLTREEFEAAEKKAMPEKDDSKDDRKEKKREEKERKQKELEEKEREEKRQRHLRPWDQGKDNISGRRTSLSDDEKWEYRPEKPEPMSQEQWNEMKRTERNPDFAPPSSAEPAFNRFTTKKSKPFKPSNTMTHGNSFNEPIRNEVNDNDHPAVQEDEFSELLPTTESFNRFTTKKPLKRRNEMAHQNMFNQPIRNELDGNDFPVDEDDESNKRRRAEFAPPPTFDYYGPSSSTKPKTHVQNPDISSSIEAGLRFLREKSDKSAPGSKQSWVANTTYEE